MRGLGLILVPVLMAYWVWDLWRSATAGHWIEVVGVLLATASMGWLSLVWLSEAIRENRRQELRQAADAAREVLARHGEQGDDVGEAVTGPTASSC